MRRGGITVRGLASAMVLAVLFFLPAGLWLSGVASPIAAKTAVPPPSLSVIQTLSDLATARVHINSDIEGENAHWRGKWSLHGEAVLGVDLAKATYVQTQSDKREAVLRLPQPHLIQSKVDHERSEELYVKQLTWLALSSPKVLRDEVWRQADRKLERLAHEPGYAERAKVQAERVLGSLFDGVGWKVRYEWE